jgi:hypothetical protein
MILEHGPFQQRRSINSCAAHGGKARDRSAMVRALEMTATNVIGKT